MAAGKTSFAEQLATRCKPYMEELRDNVSTQGMAKFDAYIDSLNAKATADSAQVIQKLEELDEHTKEALLSIDEELNSKSGSSIQKDLDEIKKALKSSDKQSTDKESISDKIQKIEKAQKDKAKKDEDESKKVDKDIKDGEKKNQDDKKEADKNAKKVNSTIYRNNKLLNKIDKKVHESKLAKIFKWIAIILGSAMLFPMLKPLWNALKTELYAFLGVKDGAELWSKISSTVGGFFSENFPQLTKTVTDMWTWTKDKYTEIHDFIEDMRNKFGIAKKVGKFVGNTTKTVVRSLPGIGMLAKVAPVAKRAAKAAWNYFDFKKPEEQGTGASLTAPEYAESSTGSDNGFATGETADSELLTTNLDEWREHPENNELGAVSPDNIQRLLAEGKIKKNEAYSAALDRYALPQEKAQGIDTTMYEWTDAATHGSHPGDKTEGKDARPLMLVSTNTAQLVFNIQNESPYGR